MFGRLRKWWRSLPRLDPEVYYEDDIGRIYARAPVREQGGK
jgi:hypothetical protein